MIEEIAIRNLGVIAEATVPLGPGFTAVTGETGAGKTMVVNAVGLLLGGRADSGAVRAGSDQAWVEGRWLLAADSPIVERAREAGGDLDPIGASQVELVLGRSVSSEGRSRAVVGGRSAPAGVLAELGEQLVVVHGQADQLRLRSQTAQREALDRFVGPAFAASLDEYRHVYRRWNANRTELAELIEERDRRALEAAQLRATLAEIEAVAPQPGEDAQLAERAERLSNAEELRLAAAEAREALSAEEGDARDVLTLLETARRSLEHGGRHDSVLADLATTIHELAYAVQDAAATLSTYLDALDGDSARELELVEERRAELGALTRKYGPHLDDVLSLMNTGGDRLLELDGDADRIDELEVLVANDEAVALELAAALTADRSKAATALSAAVGVELAALAMPDARLVIAVEQRESAAAGLDANGADTVAMLLQPHPATEPRPLARGASGGELSRVMLAIEVVLAGDGSVPTFVFDEVDAGVGGAAAIEIGRRLARLAETAQVIVVTHLAQVAAFASNHLSVAKGTGGAIVAASVRRLDGEERTAEMARLLSGLPDSESGLAHASELIEMARGA